MIQGNKISAFPVVVLSTALVMGGLISGCAPRNNLALERARASYLQAQQNPQIVTHAPAALNDAKVALNRAEETWESTHDQEEVAHLSYVTEQKVEVARATAQEKIAEAEAQQLASERERVLLEARTREAERARLSAQEAAARAREATDLAVGATARATLLEQELAELKARETERGVVMTLQEDVLFEYDKADLKPGAMRNLYPLVTFLRNHPTRTLLIEGHTDSTGSDSYNADLSRRRAEAVRYFLVQNGISPERIVAQGYGEAYPVTSNDNEAGRQQNRRVEIVISHEGQRVAERLR